MRKGKGGGGLSTAYAVLGYMACSAGMLLVNKLAVHSMPTPGFVLLCQLAASAVFTWGAGRLRYIEVDPLSVDKVRKFWIVPVAFLMTVFANIKILQHSNVETFITFRASTPIIISVLDWALMGRELPSRKSWVCLFGLLVGALMYLYFEKGSMTATSYFWVAAWYCIFVFDQIFIKHITNTVKMTTWGRVYYTNALPVIPLFFIMYFTGEFEKLSSMEISLHSQFWLLVSCACGVAISYFAFLARAAVSATSFTVLGNTCKVITVSLNILIWDNHATAEGIMSLFMCLVCAFFYEQAPKRAKGLPE
ncbi:GDP-fucose transporter 1 [Hondaea fermentalgiana]|uniref:GDP-fucose transporter 1 n=1 Tax=Hondaea fermentalgiana TaxID=2315210 RepID=A0A2R5G2P0_9STRA|nr:GDP-fucose transporter 1 [Hondaea fermentalgiana]|eukprot:GBG23998.1 GDP-fucose transporter 1 [Hondaea fermentalgiana]